jgi:transcriptional regulator with XRE-family HTH domain
MTVEFAYYRRMKTTLPKIDLERIRNLRTAQRIPARVIGELIGVKVKQVYEMEQGRSRIYADQLKAIANHFQVPADDFYIKS